jgi:hypothetical protein
MLPVGRRDFGRIKAASHWQDAKLKTSWLQQDGRHWETARSMQPFFLVTVAPASTPRSKLSSKRPGPCRCQPSPNHVLLHTMQPLSNTRQTQRSCTTPAGPISGTTSASLGCGAPKSKNRKPLMLAGSPTRWVMDRAHDCPSRLH